jgi:hypothetical protein
MPARLGAQLLQNGLCLHWEQLTLVLGTGAQLRELPENYPPFQTCHRRFQQWVRSGKFEQALGELARHLNERGQLNL